MTNPTSGWDRIPVYGVYQHATDGSPVSGSVQFTLAQRITRTDGRIIYPDGATVTVTIGIVNTQDPTVTATVHDAWKAVDSALPGYDSVAWESWWTNSVLPAAVFTSFPAADDPDIVQTGYQVLVKETLDGGGGKSYVIQPLLSMLAQAIPGIDLGMIDVPPGTPVIQPVYAKGLPGGVASLDANGKVPDSQLSHPIWTGTDAEYAAIATKDPNTLYFTHA